MISVVFDFLPQTDNDEGFCSKRRPLVTIDITADSEGDALQEAWSFAELLTIDTGETHVVIRN